MRRASMALMRLVPSGAHRETAMTAVGTGAVGTGLRMRNRRQWPHLGHGAM